jgi:hypothetical protein
MKNYSELIKKLYSNVYIDTFPRYTLRQVYEGVNVYLENTPLYEVEFNKETVSKVKLIIENTWNQTAVGQGLG